MPGQDLVFPSNPLCFQLLSFQAVSTILTAVLGGKWVE